MSRSTSNTPRRARFTTVAVTAALALGVGAGVTACASSAGGPTRDEVAAANAEAAKQADLTADAYQRLSATITGARDLATEAEADLADPTLLDNLTTATDTAREIDPVAAYKPVDDIELAKTKLYDLKLQADEMNAAETNLAAAIKAVEDAEG